MFLIPDGKSTVEVANAKNMSQNIEPYWMYLEMWKFIQFPFRMAGRSTVGIAANKIESNIEHCDRVMTENWQYMPNDGMANKMKWFVG